MKKIILVLFRNLKINSKSKIVFAIRRTTKGTQIEYIPVAKVKGLFSDWTPIVKIYPNNYCLLPYEVAGLTIEECHEHITGYKEQLIKEDIQNQLNVEYIEITNS